MVKRGLAVEVRDLVRLPDTRGMRPAELNVTRSGWARIGFARDLPTGAGSSASGPALGAARCR